MEYEARRGTRRLVAALMLVLGLALAPVCTDEEPATDDAPGDAADAPSDGFSPPDGEAVEGDIDEDSTVEGERFDRADTDDWSAPSGTLETCAELLECLSQCPSDSSECLGACHDAASQRAASDAQALTNCVNSNRCQDEHCVMQECGRELEVCFEG